MVVQEAEARRIWGFRSEKSRSATDNLTRCIDSAPFPLLLLPLLFSLYFVVVDDDESSREGWQKRVSTQRWRLHRRMPFSLRAHFSICQPVFQATLIDLLPFSCLVSFSSFYFRVYIFLFLILRTPKEETRGETKRRGESATRTDRNMASSSFKCQISSPGIRLLSRAQIPRYNITGFPGPNFDCIPSFCFNWFSLRPGWRGWWKAISRRALQRSFLLISLGDRERR